MSKFLSVRNTINFWVPIIDNSNNSVAKNYVWWCIMWSFLFMDVCTHKHVGESWEIHVLLYMYIWYVVHGTHVVSMCGNNRNVVGALWAGWAKNVGHARVCICAINRPNVYLSCSMRRNVRKPLTDMFKVPLTHPPPSKTCALSASVVCRRQLRQTTKHAHGGRGVE